jgi:hypothetical protein
VVPILQTNSVSVAHHEMVRLKYDSGAVIEMSPTHPTADGRLFKDLDTNEPGITHIDRVPYNDDRTFDILPASDTGIYFSNGIPIGSKLFAGIAGEQDTPRCCDAKLQWNDTTKQHELISETQHLSVGSSRDF